MNIALLTVLKNGLIIGVSVSFVAASALGGCSEELAQWQADNREFYDELSLGSFHNRRDHCGLIDSADLRHPAVMALLKCQDKPSGSILEIGGGFGRVVAFLLNETSIPRIEVIEHSNANARILRRMYQGQSRVRLHHQDVIEQIEGLKVNGALWMWAGFFELAPQDKAVALENIYDLLNAGGFLIIDKPPDVDHLNNSDLHINRSETFLDFKVTDHCGERTIHLHLMSESAIIKAAAKAGLIHVKTVYCPVPSTNRTVRTLLIFEKE